MQTTKEILELNGVRIPLDPAFISPKIENSIRRGAYERPEVKGTPKFLGPSDRVLELGAGLGYISGYVGAVLGVGEILCVEANARLKPFIEKVHALNGLEGVEVRSCVAVSDAYDTGGADTATFYIRDPFWSSSLSPEGGYSETVDVPILRLSELIREFRPTALIVDIEGGERDLFEKLDTGSVEKIYLELHTRKIHFEGIRKCFDDLSALGFVYDQRVSQQGAVLFRRM